MERKEQITQRMTDALTIASKYMIKKEPESFQNWYFVALELRDILEMENEKFRELEQEIYAKTKKFLEAKTDPNTTITEW